MDRRKPLRIAVGQLWQETNTFNPNPTVWSDFENWGVAEGEEVVERYGETGELGGFLSRWSENRGSTNDELLGLARFACWPWGRVESSTWSMIRQSFSRQLQQIGAVDGVFLALHGAMASDDEHDLTGAVLEMVRGSVGPDVPIVGSLDLHAIITPRMLDSADLLVGYHTCPHLDAIETGQRSADGLLRLLSGESVTTRCLTLPMICAAELQNTFTGPPARLYRRLESLEEDPRVLTAGLYMSMPWFDCPHLGWSIVLSTSDDLAVWRESVDELAAGCWEIREEMEAVERYEPREAVERALAVEGTPVVIGDGADATNSGAPGDSTHLLAEFLRQEQIPGGAMVFLVDPDGVAAAIEAGEGAAFDGDVGGGYAPEYSPSVRLTGVVQRLLDVDWVLDGHIGRNLPIHMGRGAVVRSGDVSVLLVERSGPGSSPRLYVTAGLDPTTCGLVVARSPAGFRAEYDPFVAATVLADCPGCAAPNWSRLRVQNVPRPLWPLDAVVGPSEGGWVWPPVA